MSKINVEKIKELSSVREKIDQVDSQLLDLLTQRSHWIEKIAEIKCRNRCSIYDGERENLILEKVTAENPTSYQATDMASIFHAILRAGLNQQLLYRSEHKD